MNTLGNSIVEIIDNIESDPSYNRINNFDLRLDNDRLIMSMLVRKIYIKESIIFKSTGPRAMHKVYDRYRSEEIISTGYEANRYIRRLLINSMQHLHNTAQMVAITIR